MTDMPSRDDPTSAGLRRSEEFLRQSGASSAALEKFETLVRGIPADQVEVYLTLLLQLSPAVMAQFVAHLHNSPDDQYVLGPDSLPHPEVPRGNVFEFTLDHSRIFPGTRRHIKVYVPAEYTAKAPACVYIVLDDFLFNEPMVFDNLIYKHQMPVTIGVAIEAGTAESANLPKGPRCNRSYEFDSLNCQFARFVLTEVLPAVESHQTPSGLPIRLSGSPNDRAVAGTSSGGIGAFTLAWRRPDAFQRVFTAVGTFVGMRGGDRYPVLVRKTEPKAIRIFMQDGLNDECLYLPEVGDWWMSNQEMERALEFAGYQVAHAWGQGTHNRQHASAVFPDAMRYLWKDWPKPVTAGESSNLFLYAILHPGESWQRLPGSYQTDGVLAVDPTGAALLRDMKSGKTLRVSATGQPSDYEILKGSCDGLAFGGDGRIYTSAGDAIRVGAAGDRPTILTRAVRSSHFIITHDGRLYLTESGRGNHGGKVWLVKARGEKLLLDSGLNHPSGIALSPDGLWLAVAESGTHWGYSYRVERDGTVQDKQRFYWFHVSDDDDNSGVSAWVMDRDGRLYAATRMGVQIFDRNGRVRAILPLPGDSAATGLAFGGADFDILYASGADHRLYRRKLKVTGAPPWLPPMELPLPLSVS